MLVRFEGTWLDQAIYVNPTHVKTLRQHMENQPIPHHSGLGQIVKRFPVAGKVVIEYNLTTNDDSYSDVVFGTLDEVAARLNSEKP